MISHGCKIWMEILDFTTLTPFPFRVAPGVSCFPVFRSSVVACRRRGVPMTWMSGWAISRTITVAAFDAGTSKLDGTDVFFFFNLPSLRLAAILHLKMDGWNTMSRFLSGVSAYFQGCLLLVSGRCIRLSFVPYILSIICVRRKQTQS